MRVGLHHLANRALLWRKGALETLSELEARTFTPVEPAKIFPRMGQFSLGGAIAVQHTATTCGTTVLAIANALFDRDLLRRLQHDEPGLDVSERRYLAVREFTALQEDLLAQVTGRSWPRAFGTPPWGLARQLHVPGVTYEHMPIDDTNPALAEVLTGVFRRALAAGIPIPLYVGGTLRGKIVGAVPRHVVLLIPPAAVRGAAPMNNPRIYEPGSGRVYRREWEWLWNRAKPEVALGGWSNVAWALIPRST